MSPHADYVINNSEQKNCACIYVRKALNPLNLKFSMILCKKCAEMSLNFFFSGFIKFFFNFQRNQHKPYLISAHSADFGHKNPLKAADPSTRAFRNYHILNIVG